MNRRLVALALTGMLAAVSCSKTTQTLPFSVIPQPAEVEISGGGGYRLKSSDLIVSEQIDDNVKSAIAEFAAHLQTVAGGKNSIISGE